MTEVDSAFAEIVVRPSGVWNSRAPFNDYLIARRTVLRTYNALTLAVRRLTVDAEKPGAKTRSAGKWLKVAETRKQAGVSWREYRRTLPRDSPDPDELPTVSVEEFIGHLADAVYHIRRDALVAHAGIFETYTQCWALNILLAKLEGGSPWSPSERRLAHSFSPERDSDDIPTVPRILQTFLEIEQGLSRLGAIGQTPTSGALNDVNAPTAIDAVRFWRAARNVIVHRGGIVSARFFRRHQRFIEALRAHYSYMEPLTVVGGFKFYDDVVRSMAAVHYKAARWMNEHLQALSQERRGHLAAPGPKPKEEFFRGEVQSPPLLAPGDHEPSYRWATDASFRSAMRSGRIA